jgi:hypothetical protein
LPYPVNKNCRTQFLFKNGIRTRIMPYTVKYAQLAVCSIKQDEIIKTINNTLPTDEITGL